MGEVGVKCVITCGLVFGSKQLLTHADELGGAVRSVIQSAQKLLSPRLGCLMESNDRGRASVSAVIFNCLVELGRVGPELFMQHKQEFLRALALECAPAIEYLGGKRHARGLAPARQQHFTKCLEIDLGGDLRGARAGKQKLASAIRDALQHVGEEGSLRHAISPLFCRPARCGPF
ncbi:hypothetical protein ACVIGV_005764 [Rhizobium leguminosarum]